MNLEPLMCIVADLVLAAFMYLELIVKLDPLIQIVSVTEKFQIM